MSITQGRSSGGNHSSLTKRVSDLERLLSRFSPQRMRLADSTGKMGTYMVLVARSGTADASFNNPPFSLRELKKDGANFNVTIWPGWLRDIITKGGEGVDGVLFIMPKAGEKELSADPAPEIAMKMGDYLYCHYTSDKKGNVTGDASIVADKKDKKSVHYQPDTDGEGGADGDYWIKVGKLETVDGKTTWKSYQNSDIEHYHELPSFKNVGDGSAVFKERDALEDSYKMRRVRGLYGLTDDQETDRITLNVDAENVGEGEKVLVVPEGEETNAGTDGKMQLRTIRAMTEEEASEATGSPQIRVVTVENSIVVKGNQKKGSLTLNDCNNVQVLKLEWEDGLITSSGDMSGILGDCNRSSEETPPPP